MYPHDYRTLAEMTDGYSGHDVAVVVRDALMQPIRKIQQATHFKPVIDETDGKEKLTPCSPGDEGAREMNWMDLATDELKEPPLTIKDFIKAIKIIDQQLMKQISHNMLNSQRILVKKVIKRGANE